MTFETWKDLYVVLPMMDEATLRDAINHETSTYRRKSIIARMHSRYSKLRTARERDLLLKGEMLL